MTCLLRGSRICSEPFKDDHNILCFSRRTTEVSTLQRADLFGSTLFAELSAKGPGWFFPYFSGSRTAKTKTSVLRRGEMCAFPGGRGAGFMPGGSISLKETMCCIFLETTSGACFLLKASNTVRAGWSDGVTVGGMH